MHFWILPSVILRRQAQGHWERDERNASVYGAFKDTEMKQYYKMLQQQLYKESSWSKKHFAMLQQMGLKLFASLADANSGHCYMLKKMCGLEPGKHPRRFRYYSFFGCDLGMHEYCPSYTFFCKTKKVRHMKVFHQYYPTLGKPHTFAVLKLIKMWCVVLPFPQGISWLSTENQQYMWWSVSTLLRETVLVYQLMSKLERKFSWIWIRSKQKMIRKGKMSRLKRKSKTKCSKKVCNQKNSIVMKM